jgi:hypothetical protein
MTIVFGFGADRLPHLRDALHDVGEDVLVGRRAPSQNAVFAAVIVESSRR